MISCNNWKQTTGDYQYETGQNSTIVYPFMKAVKFSLSSNCKHTFITQWINWFVLIGWQIESYLKPYK